MSLDELQGIAALAVNEEAPTTNGGKPNVLVPHYAGIPGVTRQLTANFSQEDLDMAVFNDSGTDDTLGGDE